ncbi:MAG: hypothetical protein LBB79_09410 [Prevotellaceae bacterium]|nr:hypothetical protein [Prevotellaceae bacterium]
MENKSTKNDVEQEIDLWEILQNFGRWLAKITRIFFLFLLRKSVRLACFIFVGVATGGILYIRSKPDYSTRLLMRVNTVNDFFYVNLINENLARERNINIFRELVNKLAIPENIAKQIKHIQACYAIDFNKDGLPDAMDENNEYSNSRDSTKIKQILHSMFYVNVHVYSTEALPHIRKSIVNFINNNDYVQRHNAQRIEKLNERTSYLNHQQTRLDSLQRVEYFQKERNKKSASSGQLLVLNEQPQPLYHAELISLNNQILENNTELLLYAEPVTIIQDFAETSRRSNGVLHYVVPFAISFFFIGLAFLAIWDYRKSLAKLYREKLS